jgi:hypothetical protein
VVGRGQLGSEMQALCHPPTNPHSHPLALPRGHADAEMLYDAKYGKLENGRMTREQYAALRRKVGGTAKDYWKSWIDVKGDYVGECCFGVCVRGGGAIWLYSHSLRPLEQSTDKHRRSTHACALPALPPTHPCMRSRCRQGLCER